MTHDEFYSACAELLGTHHDGEAFPYYKRTRWNNRKAGRGRFPGCGLIKAHGELVLIQLHSPKSVTAQIEGLAEALDFLRAELSL